MPHVGSRSACARCGLVFRSPTRKLMLTMLGAIATFERDLMLERQREGIAKAAARENTSRALSGRPGSAPGPPVCVGRC
jgi:DNA invertase Pin-like site-specific DNA recombinase